MIWRRVLALGAVAGCGRIAFDPSAAPSDATGDTQPLPATQLAQFNAFDFGAVATGTLVVPGDLQSGNTVILAINFNGPGLVTSVAGLGNVNYTLTGPFVRGNYTMYIASGMVMQSGPEQITANLSTPANSFLALRAHEYRGALSLDGFDHFTGTAIGTDVVFAAPFTTQFRDEMLFEFAMCYCTLTPGSTPQTIRSTFEDDITADLDLPDPTTVQPRLTSDGNPWTVVLASFRRF